MGNFDEAVNAIPRRSRRDRWTAAEAAIQAAIDEVERAGADARLTDAVVLLAAARESVADFVDGTPRRRRGVAVADA